jgi:heme-degrading monooxygenase HmoA
MSARSASSSASKSRPGRRGRLVARIWHGVVPAAKGDAYAGYLRRTGVPDCRATPGNRGVDVLRRTVGGETHFLFVSFWESIDAIRGFAGDDVERAHYYPEDRDYLIELEPTVTHYEVIEE